jgi:hypothetical protein
MRRRRDQPAGVVGQHAHAEGLECAFHFVVGDHGAQQPRDPVTAELHLRAFGQAVGILDHLQGAGLAAGNLHEKLRGTFLRALLMQRIDAALETLPGIRDQAITAPAAGNGGAREKVRFEQHIDGVSDAGRAQTAHDAAQPDGTFRVGDHHHVG